MWDDLESVPWARLKHNYGTAEDVPGLLRASAAGDLDAFSTLDNHLFHQGGWVCPAVTAALPFLVRLAADPGIELRADVLELITLVARTSISVQRRFVDDDWPAALLRQAPQLLSLLADADPVIRRAAAQQAGALPVEAALRALLTRWPSEPDPVARWEIALSLGDLLARTPAGPGAADAVALLTRGLGSDDYQLALACVHALHTAARITPAEHLDLLLRAVTGDVTGWSLAPRVDGGRTAVITWTAALLNEDPLAAAAYATGIGRGTSDPQRRVAMAKVAGGLLQRWRAPALALSADLVAWLDDPVPEVRYRAAFLLGGIAPVAPVGADHTDALAAVADDQGMREPRTGLTVGAAAQWALSRLGDERCVPGLLSQVTRSSPAIPGSRPVPRDAQLPHLPAVHQLIAAVPQYSAAFLPQLRRILGEFSHAPSRAAEEWISVTTAWGERAAATVPELVALLAHESTWWPAVRALAHLGPAAADAVPALQPLVPTSFTAAWAHWRITGQSGPVLTLLPQDLSTTTSRQVFQQIGDLGPLAAGRVDGLRDAGRSTDDWVRVEVARACWSTGEDPQTALSLLLDLLHPITEGRYLPVQLTALRYLAVLGPAAEAAVPIARAILDDPRRISTTQDWLNDGWRVFAEDDDFRAAAAELIHAARS